MFIKKFNENWYHILNIILNNKGNFIKVSQNRFNEFLSYLEDEERYEECQILMDNKHNIIFGV